jgi:hypothetical protein
MQSLSRGLLRQALSKLLLPPKLASATLAGRTLNPRSYLPKIELGGIPQASLLSLNMEVTYGPTLTRKRIGRALAEDAIMKISTFKRKKPKVRKDRKRTIRRKLRRKSQRKRAKYNL